MTNNQFKNTFLRSEAQRALSMAQANIKAGHPVVASAWLDRGLAFARQLPSNGKWRMYRAQFAVAIEALQ